ncbi:unnamed protein product [Rhizopus stolonifer]
MHCFNIIDEIPESEPMGIETVENDLYGTIELGRARNNYVGFRQDISMSSKISKVKADEKEDDGSKVGPIKVAKSKTLGFYRSYAPEQVQELLDLVIEAGISARKAGMMVGIVEITA